MPKTKTLVKICGITSEHQAVQIADFGADAIGVISVKESPRYISSNKKNKIFKTLANLDPHIERVSVVKNCPIESIIENFSGNPSETTIQLHGDEEVDYCRKLRKAVPNIGIWKAFRIKTQNDLDKIKSYEKYVDAILLDSWNKDTYGGSGEKINSTLLVDLKFTKPWWLAGGVSLDWADEILLKIKPTGIDISSSVETSPGLKDLEKTNTLIEYLKSS